MGASGSGRAVPFHRPWLDERESNAVRAALEGRLAGDGPIGRRVERRLAEQLGAHRVFLTTSCTHAMELALLALGIGPGHEVICPSFTFVSTANAVLRVGAQPVFADIEDQTLGLDVADVERRLTRRTAAVMPVHYAGVAPDMEPLLDLARGRGFRIVEDAAQALGARWRGRALGALGDAGCLSFHESKNVTCGEGGALVLGDPDLARRAEIIREKGTNRAAFLRGEVDKYTWVAEGSSYVLSDVLAAILEVQLDKLPEVERRRAAVVARYRARLGQWAREAGVRLPAELPEREPNHHVFYLLYPDETSRDAALFALRERGVMASFHYVPLHSAPHGQALGVGDQSLPVTDRIAATLLRLPLHPLMNDLDVDHVIESVVATGIPPVSDAAPLVSVVLACYNEAEHIEESFGEIRETLVQSGWPFEIVFVDDVSGDGTRELLQRIVETHRHLDVRLILHEKNKGRGATVTDGFRAARGAIAGFLDVDLEVHCRYIPSLVRALERGADVATVRRIYAFQLGSLDRYFMSRGYSFLVRHLLGVPYGDTETGYKFFRRETVLPLLDEIEDEGWFWDTEFMARASRRGLKVEEIPGAYIRRGDKTSTVRGVSDSVRYFRQLLRFRSKLRKESR